MPSKIVLGFRGPATGVTWAFGPKESENEFPGEKSKTESKKSQNRLLFDSMFASF